MAHTRFHLQEKVCLHVQKIKDRAYQKLVQDTMPLETVSCPQYRFRSVAQQWKDHKTSGRTLPQRTPRGWLRRTGPSCDLSDGSLIWCSLASPVPSEVRVPGLGAAFANFYLQRCWAMKCARQGFDFVGRVRECTHSHVDSGAVVLAIGATTTLRTVPGRCALFIGHM